MVWVPIAPPVSCRGDRGRTVVQPSLHAFIKHTMHGSIDNLPEWSKGEHLRCSIARCVGSNPTVGNFFLLPTIPPPQAVVRVCTGQESDQDLSAPGTHRRETVANHRRQGVTMPYACTYLYIYAIRGQRSPRKHALSLMSETAWPQVRGLAPKTAPDAYGCVHAQQLYENRC